jgi:predicted nucleotidyltransferase
MTRDDIPATIRANEAELRKLQVNELALFGSFVWGDETQASDIDFLRRIRPEDIRQLRGPSATAGASLPTKDRSVIKSCIRPRLRDNILSEAIRAA